MIEPKTRPEGVHVLELPPHVGQVVMYTDSTGDSSIAIIKRVYVALVDVSVFRASKTNLELEGVPWSQLQKRGAASPRRLGRRRL